MCTGENPPFLSLSICIANTTAIRLHDYRAIYDPLPAPLVCAINHSKLVFAISCKGLAFTRYYFTSRLLCTNQLSFHSPRPPTFPTLVQYYCTTIGQYTTPPPPPPPPISRLYAMHRTTLVITISCEGQVRRREPKKPPIRPLTLVVAVCVGSVWVPCVALPSGGG